MLLLRSKIFWIATSAILLLALLWQAAHPKIEFKEKTVTKIQERVKTLTKIVESPDGTKVTIIDTDASRNTETTSERKQKSGGSWQIVATMTQDKISDPTPRYGIGFTRELFLGLSGGVYGTSDKEYGLIVTYSF
jgi:hypothetical protein